MAYSELIKDFNKIRAYIREFYVYGFRSREEFDEKSSRSYDNERRRVESWLGDYMRFRQDETGKQVFLSILKKNPGFFDGCDMTWYNEQDILCQLRMRHIVNQRQQERIRRVLLKHGGQMRSF